MQETDDGHFKVCSVQPGGLSAGVMQIDDIIVQINGKNVAGEPLTTLIQSIVNSARCLCLVICVVFC